MGNGLTVPYLYDRAMEGRRTVGNPVTGFRCKRVGVPCRQIRRAELKRDAAGAIPEVAEPPLPRKASKYRPCKPYRKPTQVDGMNNPRRSRELWPRNSAK